MQKPVREIEQTGDVEDVPENRAVFLKTHRIFKKPSGFLKNPKKPMKIKRKMKIKKKKIFLPL